MFEQSILNGATKTRRVWTAMVSFMGQTVFIGFAILLPLIAFDRLPPVRLTPPLLAPPPAPKPPDMRTRPHVEVVAVIHGRTPHVFTAPPLIHKGVTPLVETPEPPADPLEAQNGNIVPFSPGGGQDGGVPFSPGPTTARIFTPTTVQPASHDPTPVDRQRDPVKMRAEGTVQLQAIIGLDGRIRDLRVTSGHPTLIQAAVDAVRQWVYQPTTLNGSPVEVLTTIDVNFTLKR